jgi:hypothetical protein
MLFALTAVFKNIIRDIKNKTMFSGLTKCVYQNQTRSKANDRE